MHSLVLTVHDKGWLLPQVLDGIKNNTTGTYELVVVLDGCSDNSEEVLDTFIKEEQRISVKKIITPDVFETKANNAGIRECDGDYIIIIQDDMVIKEPGWNKRMQKPFDEFIDVFGVTARSTWNYRLNPHSRHLNLPKEQDLLIDNEWSDILLHQNHINRDEGLNRTTFAVRNNICRGPMMLDHSDLLRLKMFDEIFEPQDQDDTDLCFRAFKELGKVVGGYWIDYDSDLTWGSTRPNGTDPAPWLLKAHHKNTRIVWERHQDLILSESHDENRVLK